MPVSAFTRRLLFNVQPVNRCVVIFRCLLTCPVNLSVRQSSIEPTLAPRSVHFCAIIGRDFSILTFIFRLSKFICYPVSICPLLVPVTRGLPNPILLPPCHNPSLPSICVATNIQSRLHHGLIHPVGSKNVLRSSSQKLSVFFCSVQTSPPLPPLKLTSRGVTRGHNAPDVESLRECRKVPTMSQVLSSTQYICFWKTSGSNMWASNLLLAPGAI